MSSDNLTNGWQDLSDGTVVAGTNNLTASYTDSNAGSLTQRFYEVRTGLMQVIMTLVLDRSGSMSPIPGINGAGAYLPGAVSYFIGFFNDNRDQAAMASFSSTANVDVPMQKPFKSVISNAVSNLQYIGGTFAQGGLAQGLAQNSSVIVPAGQNALKVVVYVTDGGANIIQQTLSCGTTLNIGGFDGYNSVGFWDPITPENSPLQGDPDCVISDGDPVNCFSCTSSNFFSYGSNASIPFTQFDVSAEAQYEAVQTANQMRAQGMYVYSIGLGFIEDFTFLQQIANDPASPTFNPNVPVGAALIVDTPYDLDTVFQQIAAKILP